MLRIFLFIVMILLMNLNLYAGQSTIMDTEGYSCSGDDKSRKQTEQMALSDAKRNAVEYAVTYIKSDTNVKDFMIKSDIIKAYSKASVQILEVKESNWYKDDQLGDCFKMKIKAEVVPSITKISRKKLASNSNLPLNVRIWTDKKEFKNKDKIKIYIQGNKSFYARVHYKDVEGTIIQILPNPYRTENYFNGNIIYEIPSIIDKFELKTSLPFGEEQLILYSSTSPLGDIKLIDDGGIYQVKTKEKDIGIETRNIKLKEVVEFFEERIIIKTKN